MAAKSTSPFAGLDKALLRSTKPSPPTNSEHRYGSVRHDPLSPFAHRVSAPLPG
jgi:hypothetical protein